MTLELTGMEFYAFHGCLESERKIQNLFVVDFRGEYDMSDAMRSDSLGDALDYSGIYALVARRMDESVNLLEHLAALIMRDIAMAYPQLTSFCISVAKRRPPVAGVAAWSKVTLEWPKDE